MSDWWNSLLIEKQIFYAIGIFSLAVLLLQILLTLVGVGHHDADFSGHGDPVKLATTLREALSESKTPLAAPAAAGSPPPIDLDTGAIEATLRAKGTANAGVYGFNIPQTDPRLLRRIEVDVSQHLLVLAAQTAGLWGVFSRLRWIPIIRKHFTNALSK